MPELVMKLFASFVAASVLSIALMAGLVGVALLRAGLAAVELPPLVYRLGRFARGLWDGFYYWHIADL